jgi:RNA polymerase sigma-70 factor (ECF subfamily)
MGALSNSSETNRLLQDAGRDAIGWETLFARHRERLRRMVRLRLDRRVPGRFTSTAVLDAVSREAWTRLHEYHAGRELPFSLWLRVVAGERIAAIHAEHLSGAWRGADEICLYREAMPPVNTLSLAGHLLATPAAGGLAAQRADLQLYLQDVLNQMDPLDREVLALCHFEELKNDEAALVLGLEKGETSRRYVQAVKALKDVLKRIPGFFKGERGA